MTSPSRRAEYQRAQQHTPAAKILAKMRADGEPESFIRWVAAYMAGEVGENPRATTMRARPSKPPTKETVFPSVWREQPGPGGVVKSDDPRRDAAADAAFYDNPKGTA